jgi:hypothetical protein
VLNPCGLSDPSSLAEKLEMSVAKLVVATGGPFTGVGVVGWKARKPLNPEAKVLCTPLEVNYRCCR